MRCLNGAHIRNHTKAIKIDLYAFKLNLSTATLAIENRRCRQQTVRWFEFKRINPVKWLRLWLWRFGTCVLPLLRCHFFYFIIIQVEGQQQRNETKRQFLDCECSTITTFPSVVSCYASHSHPCQHHYYFLLRPLFYSRLTTSLAATQVDTSEVTGGKCVSNNCVVTSGPNCPDNNKTHQLVISFRSRFNRHQFYIYLLWWCDSGQPMLC